MILRKRTVPNGDHESPRVRPKKCDLYGDIYDTLVSLDEGRFGQHFEEGLAATLKHDLEEETFRVATNPWVQRYCNTYKEGETTFLSRDGDELVDRRRKDGGYVRMFSFEDFTKEGLRTLMEANGEKGISQWNKKKLVEMAEMKAELSHVRPVYTALTLPEANLPSVKSVDAALRYFSRDLHCEMRNFIAYYIFEDPTFLLDIRPSLTEEDAVMWVQTVRERFRERFGKYKMVRCTSMTLYTMLKREFLEKLRPPVFSRKTEEPLY
jgi:hypothetical protein